QRAVGDLDLENVPLGPDRFELDRLEHPPVDAFETSGEVMDLDAQDGPGVEAAAAADEPSHEAPVFDPAALDVPRSEHEVRRLGGFEERPEVSRMMGEARVHLDDDLRTAAERAREPRQVGVPEPRLGGAMEDLHLGL